MYAMCMLACLLVIRMRRNGIRATLCTRSRKWWIEYDLNSSDHSNSCVCMCVYLLFFVRCTLLLTICQLATRCCIYHVYIQCKLVYSCNSSSSITCSHAFHFIHGEPTIRACYAKLETHLPFSEQRINLVSAQKTIFFNSLSRRQTNGNGTFTERIRIAFSFSTSFANVFNNFFDYFVCVCLCDLTDTSINFFKI